MRNYLDNFTYSSKYSKQDENPIRYQSLTLLRFKCQALLLCYSASVTCSDVYCKLLSSKYSKTDIEKISHVRFKDFFVMLKMMGNVWKQTIAKIIQIIF